MKWNFRFISSIQWNETKYIEQYWRKFLNRKALVVVAELEFDYDEAWRLFLLPRVSLFFYSHHVLMSFVIFY